MANGMFTKDEEDEDVVNTEAGGQRDRYGDIIRGVYTGPDTVVFPGQVDYGTIPSDLIRDEIAETQLFRDFISKFGDKLEGKGQAAADWLEALVKYGSGDATLKDMQEVDVSGLMDVEGFEDYYKDITVVQAPQTWEGIEKILRDNGYSSGEIESVRDSVGCLHPNYSIVNGKNVIDGYKLSCRENERFKGSVVLPGILSDLGYEGGGWWDKAPKQPAGTECFNNDGPGTIGNDGQCKTNTTEGTECYETVNGQIGKKGKRDANGDCIPFDDGTGDGDDGGADCKVITQENADECGYEITSDGQLVPKDLGKDPDSYPTYVNCGGGIFAETEADCPDMEGTGGYSEEQKNIGKQIKDWIEGQIDKAQDITLEDVLETVFGGNGYDPKCELTGEGEEMWDCTGTDGTEGNQCWKDCVSVGVMAGIPGLPMPPGNIDVGTVRDLEDKVKEIGGTIGDIFNAPQGDADDEGFIQRAKDWVLGKIDDIFGGIDDVTPGQITDWITGVLGTTISGVILKEIEGQKNSVIDKINEITGLPIAPTDDENCKEIEYFEAHKDKCIELGYLDCSTVGRVQTAGAKTRDDCGACTETAEDGTPYAIEETTGACKDPTTTGDPALTEEEQDCIDKGRKFENGECLEECDNPDYEVDPIDGSCGPKDTTKSPEEICQEKGLTYDSNVNNPDRDSDGCVSTDVSDPKCDDPNAQNYGEIGDCGECKANFKKDPNTGKCVPDGTTGTDCSTITSENADKCGKTDCGDGVFVDKGKQCPGGTGCPEGQKKFDGENCEDVCPDDPSIPASASACQSTTGCKPKGEVLESGCDGTTFFIRFADGECGEIYDSIPGYAGCGGGGYQCDDPNATVKEDGSCGPCKAGYVYDGAVEKCVQDSVTNPCDDPAYAAANKDKCGGTTDCNDCTCAEYAAANPDECGTAPPPEPPSGGGGGGGGGAGGMFSVDAGFELSGDPTLLPKMQFPIENFLQQYVEGMGDQNTSITSLFEGLV